MTTADVHATWRVWDAHAPALVPYKVCREGCREEWPCPARREADTLLREAGIDPYAVKRGEAVIPA